MKFPAEMTPKFEREYWLGYIFDGEKHGICSGNSSVYATYWGMRDGRHVFVGLTGDRVSVYATETEKCFTVWFGGGKDEPCVSVPEVSFVEFMPKGRHEDLARKIIQIAREEKEKEYRRICEFNSQQRSGVATLSV